MGLEGESLFYRGKRGRSVLEEEISIPAGDVRIINNRDAIVAMGTVDIDDTKGTVRVKNPYRIIGRVYSENDDEGLEVDLSKEVVVREGETLSLYKKTRKGSREIILWFESPECEPDTVPTIDDRILTPA